MPPPFGGETSPVGRFAGAVGRRPVAPRRRRAWLADPITMAPMADVTVAEEEYLQTLFWLQEAGLPMTGANVARAMQLSAPTVHEMVGGWSATATSRARAPARSSSRSTGASTPRASSAGTA